MKIRAFSALATVVALAVAAHAQTAAKATALGADRRFRISPYSPRASKRISRGKSKKGKLDTWRIYNAEKPRPSR